MPNQRKHRANSVPKGTAPEDFWPQIKMLRLKKMQKQTPGKYSAVFRVVFFHFSTSSTLGVAMNSKLLCLCLLELELLPLQRYCICTDHQCSCSVRHGCPYSIFALQVLYISGRNKTTDNTCLT